jgi:uncharacterized damage-inducible protein DinB
MRVHDLQRLYDYNYWANARLFKGLGQLTPEQFTQVMGGTYGSIRNTLVHTVSAEWGWLERCGGPPRGARLKADDFPTLQSVIDVWGRVEAYARSFLTTLSDVDLTRLVEYSFGGPTHSIAVGALLQHAAMHSMHHRGQVALLVRMLGYAPGDFDMLFYSEEAAAMPFVADAV